MITILRKPDLTVGTAITELGNLNAMGVVDPGVSGPKWWHSTAKVKVGVVIMKDSRVKAAIRTV